MIIQNVDPARESYGDYYLDGNVLTIGGIIVDLETEQDEQEKIISFGSCNGMVHRGIKPRCIYIAEVIIPPRKYETVKIDGPPLKTDEKDNEVLGTYTETIPVPLDIDSVILKLWPLEENQADSNNMEE